MTISNSDPMTRLQARLDYWRKMADDLADVLDRCRSSFRSAADTDISYEVQQVLARYREARK